MARKDDSPGRIAQIGQVYRFTRQSEPRIGLWLAAAFVGPLVVLVLLGVLVDRAILGGLFGVLIGLLAPLVVFSRRAEAAQYRMLAAQQGGSAGALQLLRRGWTITPAVAVDRHSSVVSRVTGRPGVVLVGEGQPARVRQLLVQERKRINRVAPDTPVHEFVVGDGDGQTPLRRLVRTVQKLPRVLTGSQVAEVNRRLKALETGRGPVPIPKGPLPKGAKLPPRPR